MVFGITTDYYELYNFFVKSGLSLMMPMIWGITLAGLAKFIPMITSTISGLFGGKKGASNALGSLVGAGGQAIGGIVGSKQMADAIEKYAQFGKESIEKSQDMVWGMYQQSREDLSPYRGGGAEAWNTYLREIGLSEEQITKPPSEDLDPKDFVFPPGGVGESVFDTGPAATAQERQIVENFNIQNGLPAKYEDYVHIREQDIARFGQGRTEMGEDTPDIGLGYNIDSPGAQGYFDTPGMMEQLRYKNRGLSGGQEDWDYQQEGDEGPSLAEQNFYRQRLEALRGTKGLQEQYDPQRLAAAREEAGGAPPPKRSWYNPDGSINEEHWGKSDEELAAMDEVPNADDDTFHDDWVGHHGEGFDDDMAYAGGSKWFDESTGEYREGWKDSPEYKQSYLGQQEEARKREEQRKVESGETQFQRQQLPGTYEDPNQQQQQQQLQSAVMPEQPVGDMRYRGEDTMAQRRPTQEQWGQIRQGALEDVGPRPEFDELGPRPERPDRPELGQFDPDGERYQQLSDALAEAKKPLDYEENPEIKAAYQAKISEIARSAPGGFQSTASPGSDDYVADLRGYIERRKTETGYTGHDPDWRNKQEEMYRTSLAFQPPGDRIITTPTHPGHVKSPATGERRSGASGRLLAIEANSWMGAGWWRGGRLQHDPETMELKMHPEAHYDAGKTIGYFYGDDTGWRLDPKPPTRDGLRWVPHPDSRINEHQGMGRNNADGTVNKLWDKPEGWAKFKAMTPEQRYQTNVAGLRNRQYAEKVNWPIASEQYGAYQDAQNRVIIDAWNAGGKETYINRRLDEQHNQVRDLLAKAESGRQEDVDAAKSAISSFQTSKQDYDQAMATSQSDAQAEYQTNLESAQSGFDQYRSEAADFQKETMGKYEAAVGEYDSALERYQQKQATQQAELQSYGNQIKTATDKRIQDFMSKNPQVKDVIDQTVGPGAGDKFAQPDAQPPPKGQPGAWTKPATVEDTGGPKDVPAGSMTQRMPRGPGEPGGFVDDQVREGGVTPYGDRRAVLGEPSAGWVQDQRGAGEEEFNELIRKGLGGLADRMRDRESGGKGFDWRDDPYYRGRAVPYTPSPEGFRPPGQDPYSVGRDRFPSQEELIAKREGRDEYAGGTRRYIEGEAPGYRRQSATSGYGDPRDAYAGGQPPPPMEGPYQPTGLGQAQAQQAGPPSVRAYGQAQAAPPSVRAFGAEGQQAAPGAAPPDEGLSPTSLRDYRMKHGGKELQRQLAATGQLRTTYGRNQMMKFYDKIAAESEREQYGRRISETEREYRQKFAEEERGYGRGISEEERQYGRTVGEEERGYGRARSREAELYGRRYGEEEQRYGRRQTEEERRYGRYMGEGERDYQRALQQNELLYGRSAQQREEVQRQQQFGFQRQQAGAGLGFQEQQQRAQQRQFGEELGFRGEQLGAQEQQFGQELGFRGQQLGSQQEQFGQQFGFQRQQAGLTRLQQAGEVGLRAAGASSQAGLESGRTLADLTSQSGKLQGQAALMKGQVSAGRSNLLGGLPGQVIGQTALQGLGDFFSGWGKQKNPGETKKSVDTKNQGPLDLL